MNVIKHFEDLWYTVVADPKKYCVDYKIYKIASMDCDNGIFEYETRDGLLTSSLNDASVYASGHVKWDQCSNWNFDENQDCMLHFCDKEGLINIGIILSKCFDMTKDLCKNWCEYD